MKHFVLFLLLFAAALTAVDALPSFASAPLAGREGETAIRTAAAGPAQNKDRKGAESAAPAPAAPLRLEESLDAMGTTYSIVLYGADKFKMMAAAEAAFEEV